MHDTVNFAAGQVVASSIYGGRAIEASVHFSDRASHSAENIGSAHTTGIQVRCEPSWARDVTSGELLVVEIIYLSER